MILLNLVFYTISPSIHVTNAILHKDKCTNTAYIFKLIQAAFRASALRWKGVPVSEYIPIKKSELRYTRPFAYPLSSPFHQIHQHFPTSSLCRHPLYFWLFTFSSFAIVWHFLLPSLRFLQQLLQRFSKELETPIIFHSSPAWPVHRCANTSPFRFMSKETTFAVDFI